jgi:tRNA pseudouridine38-40 synthase
MGVVRLDLSYDGTGFRGYAKQPGQRTVQGQLEGALEQILGKSIDSSVAGRTDAGVHAHHQVVSFEADDVDDSKLQRSLTSMLGGEMVVTRCSVEADGFNARFSANRRSYRYAASTARYPDPMLRNQVWFLEDEVDVGLLHDAAAQFVGEIDFTSFCRSVAGKSNVRRVERSAWESLSDGRLFYWVEANAFCHQMVRSLVGTCYDVARGYIPLSEVAQIIQRADRSTMGTVAPPHGLSLWSVGYDPS